VFSSFKNIKEKIIDYEDGHREKRTVIGD